MTSSQKRRHANVRMHVRTQPQLRTQVKLATNKHKNQGSRTLPSQLFSVADFRSLRIYEQLCYCTVSAVEHHLWHPTFGRHTLQEARFLYEV